MRELLDYVERGTHLYVTAPRRIGKTSLLLEARRRLGLACIFLFVDVQGCETEPDAVVKLVLEARAHREIGHKILDSFRNLFTGMVGRLEEIRVVALKLKLREGLSAEWRTKADEVLARLAEKEQPVVVWFDELPVLISNLLALDENGDDPDRKVRTRAFLSWLREASIRHASKVCFVISGSIGLKPLVERAGLSDTLNTFIPFQLGPWSSETALGFLADRAQRNHLQWCEGADVRLLERLRQPIPYHVQLLLDQLVKDAHRRENTHVTPADVDRVYEKSVVGHGGQVDLSTYEERLKRAVPHDMSAAALDLLTEAAVVGHLTSEAALAVVYRNNFTGARADEAFRLLIAVFEHDGYLERRGDHYEFTSLLLRDWWRRRFSFGHKPLAERQTAP
ncbi:MAG TPA: hypothetical protein VHQ90_21580 [Thermoanaerobaculia bacterium]|nr:hypothetical protein [Thermoanaerobaculia bacterium]